MRRILSLAPILVALPLTLAACRQEPAAAPDMAEETERPDASVPLPTASAAPVPTAASPDTAGIPEFGMPVALQGSWGMVPVDCTSTRGDAKGLLRISATTLTFYESLGRLTTIRTVGDTAIRARFSYTGEGTTWSRDEELSVSGNTLTRTSRGGDEPGGPFTYTRCAA